MLSQSQHQIVFMHPQSTFRDTYRSDTLWGLLCWGIRIVYGKDRLEEYLDSCQQNKPEFIISSTFPFEQKDGEKTCFFPRPILPPFQQEKDSENSSKKDEAFSIKDRKKLKKVNLLPQDFFLRLLRGEVFGQQLRSELLGIQKQHPVPQMGRVHVTHNTIDRQLGGGTFKPEGKAGLLFHTEDRFVLPDDKSVDENGDSKKVRAGLFFLLSYHQEADYNFLEPVFTLLADIGMGGDRSIGKGFFNFETQTLPDTYLKGHPKANGHVLLSLCYPLKWEAQSLDQNASDLLNYQLTVRQGKVGMIAYHRGIAKKPLLMFEEGSVFPLPLKGQIEEVIPQQTDVIPFPVYQSGMAYTVPIYIPES